MDRLSNLVFFLGIWFLAMFFQFFITINSSVKITPQVEPVATNEVVQSSDSFSINEGMEEIQDRIYSLQILQKRIEEKQQKTTEEKIK